MPKGKLTISTEADTKELAEQVGRWYLERGVDVKDHLKGGVSLSATIRQLIEDKLREIELSSDMPENLKRVKFRTPDSSDLEWGGRVVKELQDGGMVS
jgi:hypothetical protein